MERAGDSKQTNVRVSWQTYQSRFGMNGGNVHKSSDCASTSANCYESDGDSLIDESDISIFAPKLEILDTRCTKHLSPMSNAASKQTAHFSLKPIFFPKTGRKPPVIAKSAEAQQHEASLISDNSRSFECSVIEANETLSRNTSPDSVFNCSGLKLSKLFGVCNNKKQTKCRNQDKSESVFYVNTGPLVRPIEESS